MARNELNLMQMIPKKSTFTLFQFGDYEFNLRPCTGAVLLEMETEFGSVDSLLTYPTAENISKIAMFLMDYESASKFKKQTVKTIDVVTGDESIKEIGGYKLLTHAISGVAEQYSIYKAILLSMGQDEKEAEKIVNGLKENLNKIINDNNSLKKKTTGKVVKKVKKKN